MIKRLPFILTPIALLYLLLLQLQAHFNSKYSRLIEQRNATHVDAWLNDISNSTLGFQKIFVINLPSRHDLRDVVTLASVLTGLEVEFVDGVVGDTILDKSLPDGGDELNLSPGGLGNWRAHMNVARLIVEQNIQSALVLESDADWDIRIKSQMRQFAQSSRLLLQPLVNTTSSFLDPTFPQPGSMDEPISFDVADEELKNLTTTPTTSPYGDLDRWDLLWLGHCGARFPWASDLNTPLARVMINNDETVPEKSHINVELGDGQLLAQYDHHTRVVSRARVNTCTLGHAFSQQGARKFLYELGTKRMDGNTDMMFRSMCQGSSDRPLSTCLSVQPPLFPHHRSKGSRSKQSDIDDHGNDYNEHGITVNVRWSTRLNIPRLIAGRTDFIDTFEDGVIGPTWSEDE